MKFALINKRSMDDHLGCFGNFNIEDPICSKECSLRIRCTIERDQNIRLEIFEDLVGEDDLIIRVQ